MVITPYKPVAKAKAGNSRPQEEAEEEHEDVPVEEEYQEDAGDEIDPWAALGDNEAGVEGEEQQEEQYEDEGGDLAEDVAIEEDPEPEVEEEAAAPMREDDLDVEDVPEDMREAVEGSMHLKRMLDTGGSDNAAKKRRLEEAGPALDPEKQELLDRWRLGADKAAKYVINAAPLDDVRSVARSSWRPNPRATGKNGDPKSCAEQINEKLLSTKEQNLCARGQVDSIQAFVHKWKLSREDEDTLRGVNHKDLRHIMKDFDGMRSVSELAEEAAMMMPNEDRETAVEAAPERPGLMTMSRFNRLELIDPNADALVVGDANLTFSQVLAQHREGLGHVGRTVATTFETIEILRERYTEIDETVQFLEDRNCEVLHNVDGTRLAVDPRFQGMAGKFGAVYYNFPHAGVVQGFFDGHPFVRWRHENLMHLFFRALRGFVKEGGIVKVASNSNATGVRFSDIITGAENSEFVHIETVPFLEWALRNYLRSYGDRRDTGRRPGDGEIYKNQRAHSDMVYVFRYEPSGDNPPKTMIRQPPSKDDLLKSSEGKLRTLHATAKTKRVEEIYDLFLTYVQGIHVG
eukprot:TRINITY_DN94645_c0_g1_i1.p1 TRINITY_DN94645_c0_g1~~TRINITY_DN94645_c0_g1_i1.p1  ORF type:complete len:574 (+),score=152.71 TRINITY_DN94645_c0_g1_i1:65-1786(+)